MSILRLSDSVALMAIVFWHKGRTVASGCLSPVDIRILSLPQIETNIRHSAHQSENNSNVQKTLLLLIQCVKVTCKNSVISNTSQSRKKEKKKHSSQSIKNAECVYAKDAFLRSVRHVYLLLLYVRCVIRSFFGQCIATCAIRFKWRINVKTIIFRTPLHSVPFQ